MKKIIKTGILLIAFSSLFIGCSKDPTTAIDPNITPYNKDRFQKIEKFISISWETPIEKIIYNEKSQDFIFGNNSEIIMSREKIENLYDSANEYKLKYEKQP